MNILFVSESMWMQGVVYDLHVFAEGLSLLGHKVYAIDPGEDVDVQRIGVLPTDIREASRVFPGASVRLRSPRFPILSSGRFSVDKIPGARDLYKAFRRYTVISRFLREAEIDIIVLYSAARNGLQTVYLARKHGIPVVFRNQDILHNLWAHKLKRTLVKKLERRVYPLMDKLLALTPKYAEYLIRMGADKTKVELLLFPIDTRQFHPSIDCTEIRKKWKLDGEDQVIVFIGALYEFGGLIEFVGKFPSLLKEAPRAKFLIVGDGIIRPALEKLVDELNLKDKVILTGPQPFSQMPQYVNAATVCINVFPINETTKDIFSAKIIQYLACGKATVSSALPGITTAIPGEKCGVIYSETIAGVAGEVAGLLKSPERRERLEMKGLEYINEAHCHNKVILRLEEMLKKVSEKKQGRK